MVLVNCELVIEGFDLSSQVGRDVTLECCILLRPTQSVARYLQMVFRALRRKPEAAIILDHAGCIIKHGLPCERREWSLLGQPKGKRKASETPDVNVQQCKHCYAVFVPGPDACPYCGKPIEKKVRKIQEADGELEQIDLEAVRKQAKKEQGSARTLRDLVALGMRRGMAKASQWAAITAAAREQRKPTAADFNEARRIQQELTR
jgi:superfamily II DNA or RNA helicase